MSYYNDIENLNPQHIWTFDGDSDDTVGSAGGTNTGVIFTDDGISMDAGFCMTTDAVGDRVSIPSTTDINDSAQTRKAVAGWFMATAIQNPPKNIYGEGDTSQAFRFVLGWGNRIVFEVDDPNFTLQAFGDVPLEANRPYHLCMIFEGNAYGNEMRAYLDGVEQTNAEPTDRQPNAATLTARSAGEFGDPAGTVAVGGTEVILIAPINGRWNNWASWDGAEAVLTEAQVREELFEKGALADETVSSDTEANMQTAMNAYANTERGNAPICIRVEPTTSTKTGNTNVGTIDVGTENTLIGLNFRTSSSDSGMSNRITATMNADSATAINGRAAIYDGSGNLIAASSKRVLYFSAGSTNYDFTFYFDEAFEIEANTSYFICVNTDTSTVDVNVVSDDTTNYSLLYSSLAFSSDIPTSISTATTQGKPAIYIEYEDDFTLELDNITFDELASVHIQYIGASELTLINKNGADCSIISSPYGGIVNVKTEKTITITVKDLITGLPVDGARVYIEAGSGGELTEGEEIMNTTTNSSGIATISFNYSSDQPITGRVRQGTSSTFYKTGTISGPITSAGLAETILLIPDN